MITTLLPFLSEVLMKKVPNNLAKRKLSHLPRRSAVNIEFNNVSYSVSEGRRGGTVLEITDNFIHFTLYSIISVLIVLFH